MANQLYTQENQVKKNVYPKNYTENIVDKQSGIALPEILNGFNCYFLSYTGDKESTRLQVPVSLRKEGIWITYVDYNHKVVTEWYNSKKINDLEFKKSSNWRIGSNMLVGDLSISSNGNWVINGEETEFKAQGEAGQTPIIRFSNNRFELSYDGKAWEVISNEITDNFRIKRYVNSESDLPNDEVVGTIYGVGPLYDSTDIEQLYPYYDIYVYSNTDAGDTWINNGPFTSIEVGISQEVGGSDSLTMSQKAIRDNFVASSTVRRIDTSLTQDEIDEGIKQGTLDPNTLYLAFEEDEDE